MAVPVATAPTDAVRTADVRGLHPNLHAALATAGYSTLFPVQAAAWHVLAGGMSCRHDLCIAAPTGSGKTLAYALPLLQRCLQQPSAEGLRALVVVPTRALAQQVRGYLRLSTQVNAMSKRTQQLWYRHNCLRYAAHRNAEYRQEGYLGISRGKEPKKRA
jgi:Lhr-like helicase